MSRSRSGDQTERGYTLLEMLLVLVLLAGAGFVLLIKLPVQLEKEHLSFAATQLLEDIRNVRQTALAENNWYEVKFYLEDGNHHYQIFRAGTRVKDVSLEEGIQFLGQPKNLRFNASGRSQGSTIVLTAPSGEQRHIVIAPVAMRIKEK